MGRNQHIEKRNVGIIEETASKPNKQLRVEKLSRTCDKKSGEKKIWIRGDSQQT